MVWEDEMKKDKEFFVRMLEEAQAIAKDQEYRLEVAKKMVELAKENLKKFK